MRQIYRALIVLSTFTFPLVATSQTGDPIKKVPNTKVQQKAVEIQGYNSMKHAAFSVYVKNLGSGNSVADINSEMSIPSASTMKLVTTATATQILGRGYRFRTKLMYSGEIDSMGVLNGDLYIVGGGDPTLGSRHFNKSGTERDFLKYWADSIASFGIKKINGRVIGDASLYSYDGVPSGWVWGDIGNYYGAGPSGLTIFDNMCILHFETGENAGDSTNIHCITPHIPGLNVINHVRAASSSKDNAYVYGAPYSNDWFVEGSIPKGREDFQVKASIPDPEYVAAIELDRALGDAGVETTYAPTTIRELQKKYDGFEKPEMKEILVYKSPTLASIMNVVNQKSINLFAEHILCQISVKRSGYGSTNNGALICMKYWANKIDGTGLFMTDGSGLSRSNAVSAKFLVDMLVYMKGTNSYDGFKGSLAVAGKKGTMASIGRGTTAEGRVFGKSGTMTRMKSYAGYVETKTGKSLAYAMIVNNYNCSTAQVTKYLKAIMVQMSIY